MTAGITGAFEVYIDGNLVHSKKNGQGFPTSVESIEKIAECIRTCILTKQ